MIFYAGCPVPQAYDPEGVGVSDIPRGTVGKTVTFAGTVYIGVPPDR